jgi:hypothetical protein
MNRLATHQQGKQATEFLAKKAVSARRSKGRISIMLNTILNYRAREKEVASISAKTITLRG